MSTATRYDDNHADDEMLSIEEAAAFLRASVDTMRYWRYDGTGPFSAIGGALGIDGFSLFVTVVIAAAQDHATPTEFGRHIADDLPDSELYIVGDAAHLAVVEAPRTISVILDDHFGND